MNNERVVEDIVTKFLLNTCRLRQQCSRPAVQATTYCVQLSTQHPLDDTEADFIPLTTGSVAEFYIEPMITHFGDVDVMCHGSTQLAIPRGHPPPTQLPAEFSNYVRVFEIIDSHLHGYVYLKRRYLLTECVDEGKYNAVDLDKQIYYLRNIYHFCDSDDIHGPAMHRFHPYAVVSESDIVRCVRCLVWLQQAADWPTRHRNCGWPDTATVDRVVSNGCDVVPVAHRQCRQHELMGERQWRLSFSRAEIVLINNWTTVQQIVYHMLRVFMKTERLTESDNFGAGTLSNYHIKTLMLWACELKPRTRWTDDISLVKICVELLHNLAVLLTKVRCPHYFINNCNLVDSSISYEVIQSRLISITRPWLSTWFVNNYIRRCSELCPRSVSRLLDDASTTIKLQNAVSEIVNWRLNTTISDMFRAFNFALYSMVSDVFDRPLNVRSLDCWLTELTRISTSLPLYFSSVALLHVACRASRNGLNDELMDVMAVLVGQSVGPRRYFSRNNSVLLLSKAADLMKAVDDRTKLRSTVQLMKIELSKAYLHRSLSCEDSDSDSIYCLANVYLAVLYYTTGQYQTAIDHCTLVMRSQDHSQCSSHDVQGELLPKTDNDIDTVLGLAVFYQHVRMAALNQQHQQHVTVFTTELFAHYLHIKCLQSVTKCQQLSDTSNSQSSTDEVQRQAYVQCITGTHHMFIADVLLCQLLSGFYGHICVFKQDFCSRRYPTKYQGELGTSDVVDLLQTLAVKYLTFCQSKAQDFGSVATAVRTCFEALQAYRRGDYQQCLQLLSVRLKLRVLSHSGCVIIVPFFPEFIQLLDDDFLSLKAMTLIVNPECRTYHRDRCRYAMVSQLTLSLYLMTQCQLKLRHSVTSLAQTLDYIEVAHRKLGVKWTLERLILKMTAQKALSYITTMTNKVTTHKTNSVVSVTKKLQGGTVTVTGPLRVCRYLCRKPILSSKK